MKLRTLLLSLVVLPLITAGTAVTPKTSTFPKTAHTKPLAAKYGQATDPYFVPGANAYPGRYVVVVNDIDPNAPPANARRPSSGSNASQPIDEDGKIVVTNITQAAQDIVQQYGGTLDAVCVYAGSFIMVNTTEAQARAISNDPRVECVVADTAGSGDTTQYTDTDGGLWGLDRIDQRIRPLSRTYNDNNYNGAGVNVYILDTGIYTSHGEFQGRASLDYSAVNNTSPDDDDSRTTHGTSVASIVGGVTYGVAKGVRLHSVKTSESNNKFYVSAATKGLDWVTEHHQKPAVANCSFAGQWFALCPFSDGSRPMEKAARRLISAGVTVVVSAGNDNVDAGRYSPAKVGEAITVGAVQQSYNRTADDMASYINNGGSNYGGCLDVFAPGQSVTAAAWEFTNGMRRSKDTSFGGTSAAAPFVTGVVARYLQYHPTATPKQVHDWITFNATTNVINNLPNGTVNRLLYSNNLEIVR